CIMHSRIIVEHFLYGHLFCASLNNTHLENPQDSISYYHSFRTLLNNSQWSNSQ
ncbi:hypothetical protein P7K49_040365, partial [Saguinus oedipus]